MFSHPIFNKIKFCNLKFSLNEQIILLIAFFVLNNFALERMSTCNPTQLKNTIHNEYFQNPSGPTSFRFHSYISPRIFGKIDFSRYIFNGKCPFIVMCGSAFSKEGQKFITFNNSENDERTKIKYTKNIQQTSRVP